MEINAAVRSLSALAHEHRLGVFRLLVKAAPKGMAAGEIAEALGLPPSSLSFHLAALQSAGLVASKRAGRFIHYMVEADSIRELLAYLTEDCCEGRPELCAGPAPCGSEARPVSTPARGSSGGRTTA